MMNEKIFREKFTNTWNLLEKSVVNEDKISSYYDELKHMNPGHIVRALKWFAHQKPEGGKPVRFPTGPELVQRINIIEGQEKRDTVNRYSLEPHIAKYSEEQIESEFRALTHFYENNPYPEIPATASYEQARAIDDQYKASMRLCLISPDESIHPKNAARMCREFVKNFLDEFGKRLPYDPNVREDGSSVRAADRARSIERAAE